MKTARRPKFGTKARGEYIENRINYCQSKITYYNARMAHLKKDLKTQDGAIVKIRERELLREHKQLILKEKIEGPFYCVNPKTGRVVKIKSDKLRLCPDCLVNTLQKRRRYCDSCRKKRLNVSRNRWTKTNRGQLSNVFISNIVKSKNPDLIRLQRTVMKIDRLLKERN